MTGPAPKAGPLHAEVGSPAGPTSALTPGTRRLPRSVVIPILIVSLWMFYFEFWASPRLSSDGHSYVETASNLRHGEGFKATLTASNTFEPFTAVHFPPGIPIILAMLSLFGLSTIAAAHLLNFVSWIAVIAASTRLYRRADGSNGPTFTVVITWLALSGAIVSTQAGVWSEPLFLALTLWFLVVAEDWIASKGNPRFALLSIVIGAAALSVRYVGICLMIAAAIRIVQERGGGRRVLIRLTAVASMVAPMAAWYIIKRDGPRFDAPGQSSSMVKWADVADSFGSLGGILSGGIAYSRNQNVLGPLDPALRPILQLVGLVACIVAATVLLRSLYVARRLRQEPSDSARPNGSLLVIDFVVVYVLFMFAYRISSGYSILTRYWVPALVPAILLAAAHLARVRTQDWRKPTKLAITAFALGSLVANSVLSIYYYR